jgi:hypothetical protein
MWKMDWRREKKGKRGRTPGWVGASEGEEPAVGRPFTGLRVFIIINPSHAVMSYECGGEGERLPRDE